MSPGRPKGIPQRYVTVPMRTRMRQLRDAGLSAKATAVVIFLDYGVQFSPDTIRKYAPLDTGLGFQPGDKQSRAGMGTR